MALVSASVSAQQGEASSVVRGRVLDAQTLTPLAGVELLDRDGTVLARSDAGGFFAVAVSTQLAITARRLGFRSEAVTVTPRGTPTIVLEAIPSNLGSVRVVGFESKRPLLETPAAVAVLSAAELARYNDTNILNAMNTIPGVRFDERQPGGSTRVSIRGSILRSPFGIRNVKFYWNEIPMTLADGTTPNDVFDVAALSSVEVIKGPASSLYGAGVGGAVNLTSRRATGGSGPEVAYTGGQFGLSRIVGRWSHAADNSNVVATVVRQHSDGHRRQQDFAKRELYQVSGQFFPSGKTVVSVHAYQSRPEFGLPGNLTAAERDADPRQPLPFAPTYNAGVFRRRQWAGGNVTHSVNDALTASLSTYGMFTDWDGQSAGTSAAAASMTRENGGSFGFRGRVTWAPKVPGRLEPRLTLGGEVLQDRLQSQSYGFASPTRVGALRGSNEIHSFQRTAFGQIEADLPARVLVSVGVSANYTWFDVRDFFNTGAANKTARLTIDPAVAPRLAVNKRLGESWAVYADWSRGFSPPTSFELNPDGANATLNLDLKAEEATQAQVGMRGTFWDDRVAIDLAAFSTHGTNTIIPETGPRGGTAFSNAGSTHQRGIELMTGVELAPRGSGALVTQLRPFATWAVNDFTFDTFRVINRQTGQTTADFSGKPIPGVPASTATLGLDLASRPGFFANLTVQLVGRVSLNNAATVSEDPYELATALAGWRGSAGRWRLELFVGGDYLLNATYSSFLAVNGFGGRFFNPSLPRNFYGGTRIRLIT